MRSAAPAPSRTRPGSASSIFEVLPHVRPRTVSRMASRAPPAPSRSGRLAASSSISSNQHGTAWRPACSATSLRSWPARIWPRSFDPGSGRAIGAGCPGAGGPPRWNRDGRAADRGGERWLEGSPSIPPPQGPPETRRDSRAVGASSIAPPDTPPGVPFAPFLGLRQFPPGAQHGFQSTSGHLGTAGGRIGWQANGVKVEDLKRELRSAAGPTPWLAAMPLSSRDPNLAGAAR
jgi:hypothetical protein